MKQKIKDLERLMKDKSITPEDKQYAEASLAWLILWLESRKKGDGPSTQSDPGDHPPPPPPHH